MSQSAGASPQGPVRRWAVGVLCRAVSRCVALCCAVLCCVVLCCAVLRFAGLWGLWGAEGGI